MTGLYVHIPFCSVKCFYCDFAAFSGQGRQAKRYLAALEAEAKLMPARNPETLYIGGGTPSELASDELAELLALIKRAYPSSRFIESTCEANPDSLDAGKLSVLRRGGIDRLSLGLQTFDDRLLKEIGRRHTAEDFVRVFRLARKEGFAISVDLMYGLPNQTLESLEESLKTVLGLEPEHISLYGLQVEDRTLFAKRGVEAEEDLGREMFERALELLAGYHHYEISNFAKPGRESKHNRIYWDDGEYVGLGCGAASHLDGVRSTNVSAIKPYCDGVLSGRRPIAQEERLAGKEKVGETIFLGLRKLDGFAPTAEMEREFPREFSELGEQGLVARRGGRVRLTEQGVFLANQVAMRFVPPYL